MGENSSRYSDSLSGLVMEGIVTAVSGRLARVKLPETGEISGWLTVLRSTPAVSVQGTRAQVAPWTPAVNDRVLALFRPVENGEGYILGGL